MDTGGRALPLRQYYVAVSSAENKLVRGIVAGERAAQPALSAAAVLPPRRNRHLSSPTPAPTCWQATLLDLLRAFEAAAPLSLVACCGSRDSLDALVAAAARVPHCRVWVLVSGGGTCAGGW